MEERKGQLHGVRKLSSILSEVVEPTYNKKNKAEARLIAEWEQIVGKDIASMAQPLGLSGANSKSGASLVLRVYAGFALEVQHLEPLILERIAAYMGYKAIRAIKIKQ